MLSDAGSAVIKTYGLLNTSVPENNFVYGVPYPVTMLVNPDGTVRKKYAEPDYRERYTANDIMAQEFGVQGKPQGKAMSKRLTATYSMGAATARAGQRTMLFVDIELKPKVHVYAPGVKGYIPIDLKLDETKAVDVEGVKYPKSEILFLPAINEKVPVFQGKARISVEVKFADTKNLKPLVTPEGKVIIEGKLRFQACDDRVCYIPETLPLKWELPFEDLDRVRASEDARHK